MSGADRTDRAGAIASTVCAVHCGISALLPAAFGALGLGFLLGHEAEWAFTAFAIVFAGAALVIAWRRKRERHIAALLALGIVGLLTSRLLEGAEGHGGGHHDEHDEHGEHGHHGDGAEEDEDSWHLVGGAVGIFAGLLLVTGHVLNLRALRRAKHAHCE